MSNFDNSYSYISEEKSLNFKNKNSIKNCKLAHEELEVAENLLELSKSAEDKSCKKALNRKIAQTAMEGVEHAQKACLYAYNNKPQKISPEKFSKLENTHNNEFLQRELECLDINILEKKDIDILNSQIKKLENSKSPYNGVRYNLQDISNENVAQKINVCKKAVNNLDKMKSIQEDRTITIDEYSLNIDDLEKSIEEQPKMPIYLFKRRSGLI